MKASTIEIWRDVVGYKGVYEVSDLGRVRSLDRVVDGPRVRQGIKGKVLRMSLSYGYERVYLCQNGLPKPFYVHGLVSAAFIGPRPVGRKINHIDGDKLNSRPLNLKYVTQSENALRSYRTGLSKAMVGVKNPHAKLAEADVLAIRDTYAAGGVTMQKLSNKYGVNCSIICGIIHRKRWAHLPPA